MAREFSVIIERDGDGRVPRRAVISALRKAAPASANRLRRPPSAAMSFRDAAIRLELARAREVALALMN